MKKYLSSLTPRERRASGAGARHLAWLALPPELRDCYVLAVRQPWPHFIFNCGKDIENRSRRTNIRGRVLILASQGMTQAEFADGIDTYSRIRNTGAPVPLLRVDMADLPRGGIVGSVEIVDCVERSDSPWFFGPYGYVLRDPRPLNLIPLIGQRGFFKVAA